jgi:hypothetical protein
MASNMQLRGNMSRMIRILGWVMYVTLTVSLLAQGINNTGAGILKNFYIPERNKDGALIWELKGEKAIKRTDGKLEIENLMINTFRGANTDWTLLSPHCIFFERTEPSGESEREAVSDANVRIFNKDTEITGEGFHWLVNSSKFIIRHRVQVTIQGRITKDTP